MTESSSENRGGDRFGTYRVIELLGAGGMGRVYRALDEALQREVALKTLLPALAADSEFVSRFNREARSAAALNHPNITQIYAIGQEGAIPYFAMELIRGRSLESIVKERGALDPAAAAGYILQAAAGLRHAAEKGLIHRDVKPSNLMVAEDGTVKITDFGLAKAARTETRLTATGEVLGSPGYISPEQAQGQPIDSRSDIYSLGATFYHLVTGRLPFEAPTAVAMIMKHMNEPLRSPRAVNAGIPFPIAAVIQKMMAKRPSERFQDYGALIRELGRALGDTQPGTAAAADDQPATTVRRKAPADAGPTAPRPAAPPRPGEAPQADEKPSLPLLPVGLLVAVLALIAAGVWQQLGASRAGEAGPGSAALTLTTPPIEGEGTFTSHSTGPRAGAGPVRDQLAGPLAAVARANLVFLSNDHDVLPTGGLRVTGRVQNSGGLPARNARVRVRLLLETGALAAQGEAPLKPPLIPPGRSATFEVTLDYAGPIGTIKAELIWTD
jgi:predicted Ser/Thr protein kinase